MFAPFPFSKDASTHKFSAAQHSSNNFTLSSGTFFFSRRILHFRFEQSDISRFNVYTIFHETFVVRIQCTTFWGGQCCQTPYGAPTGHHLVVQGTIKQLPLILLCVCIIYIYIIYIYSDDNSVQVVQNAELLLPTLTLQPNVFIVPIRVGTYTVQILVVHIVSSLCALTLLGRANII